MDFLKDAFLGSAEELSCVTARLVKEKSPRTARTGHGRLKRIHVDNRYVEVA